jgi:5-methylcytosine-specific restriction protein A
MTMATELITKQWIEIFQNSELTKELDLAMLQTLYSFEGHKASASQTALILRTRHGSLNLEVGRYAKRISKHYDINLTIRSKKQYKFYDLFFNGLPDDKNFVWQLRPELVEALEKMGLTDDERFPDELPTDTAETLFEDIKRTITVNTYERNSKARELCVKHWKAICSVCDFDFEKTYGELGKGFIHVHHLIPVSQIGKTYEVDPVKDLRPVCPNCHAMLHKKSPPYAIDEMKLNIQTQSSVS